MDITNETKYVLQILYKEYLDRINNGISKREAKVFASWHNIYTSLFSNMLEEDCLESFRELGRADYLNNKWASNKIWSTQLTDKALISMENKFKNDMKSLVKSLLTLKQLLSF